VDLEPPPTRRAWEQPPDGGWAGAWTGFGVSALRLFLSAVALAAATELVWTALHFRNHRQGDRYAFWVTMWCGAAVLGLALGLYVWRNLRALFLLIAMLTDYGRVARFGGRPPVFLDEPPRNPRLRLAHLSDLHIVEAENVRLVERPEPGGNAILPRLLDAADDAELLLFTGDITDRGTSLSWRCFLDQLEDHNLSQRAVLVPGNHDLAFVDAEGNWRQDRFGIVQLANLLKFCEAFAATAGGRGSVMEGRRARPFGEAWAEAEQAVRPLVASLPSLPVPQLTLRHYLRERRPFNAYVKQIEDARERLFRLFPVAVPVGEDAVVFVINSCSGPQLHPATNALGHVGRAQYQRLERLAAAFPRRLKLVALHHHVVRRHEEMSTSLRSRVLAKFTVLGDAAPLVRFCRKHEVRAVLHGHRHLSYKLRLESGTVLLSAPSSTLGDELARDPRPQLERYDFADAPEGATVGIFRRVVRPQATPLLAVLEGGHEQ
jgi:3',5'-cyclic AMP phosphodiesterase CpdA